MYAWCEISCICNVLLNSILSHFRVMNSFLRMLNAAAFGSVSAGSHKKSVAVL